MVNINANLDLRTYGILDTGRLNETLENLTDDSLYITFVARDTEFFNGVRKYKDKTHMHVVLPYDEVLVTTNIDLLAYRYLHKNLDQIKWLDIESMRQKLDKLIRDLEPSAEN